jgi:4'-phosphopantetheinyl transferase
MVDRAQLSVHDFPAGLPISRHECERAGAYRFRQDRDRYLIARACLRVLLSGYLQIPPADVSITEGYEGKPQLRTPNPTKIEFNLTHAGRFTLIAITHGAAIGIDLEALEPPPGQIELTRYFLSNREQAAFDALPEQVQHGRFYQLWTMKEAVLKGLGTGFKLDPRKLELGVELASLELRQIVLEGGSHGLWTLFQVPVMVGYKASLAVQGAGWSLACWKMGGQLHP